MKKVAVFLICLFSSFNIFSETIYKVSSIYVEKGNRTDETTRRSTYYFVKNKNTLEKYYSEDGRISKDDGTEHDRTPNFSNIFDMVKGVKITINDVWGYNVFIENYRIESDICHFDLKIELFDHFGLDLHDVKKFGNYPIVGDGFKIWFYLQHNKKFEKQIFPFVVRIPITQNNIEVYIFEN